MLVTRVCVVLGLAGRGLARKMDSLAEDLPRKSRQLNDHDASAVEYSAANEGRAKLEFLIIRPQRKALRSQTIFIDPGHQSLEVASQGSDLRPAKEAD